MNIENKLKKLEKQIIVDTVKDFWNSYKPPVIIVSHAAVSYPISDEAKSVQKELTAKRLNDTMDKEYKRLSAELGISSEQVKAMMVKREIEPYVVNRVPVNASNKE